MFQCLILSFRLFIDLWMKGDAQLALDTNAIAQRELIAVDKKRTSIKYHFSYFEKDQEHFIK